jgi:hypothetical protein
MPVMLVSVCIQRPKREITGGKTILLVAIRCDSQKQTTRELLCRKLNKVATFFVDGVTTGGRSLPRLSAAPERDGSPGPPLSRALDDAPSLPQPQYSYDAGKL